MKFESKYGPINVREIGKSASTSKDELIRGSFAYLHTVQVTFNGKTAQFPFTSSINDYEANKKELSNDSLLHALECWITDGIHYAEMDFEDFCDEFGYYMWADDPEDAYPGTDYYKTSFNLYKASEKARNQASRLGITLDMAYDISNELRELE